MLLQCWSTSTTTVAAPMVVGRRFGVSIFWLDEKLSVAGVGAKRKGTGGGRGNSIFRIFKFSGSSDSILFLCCSFKNGILDAGASPV